MCIPKREAITYNVTFHNIIWLNDWGTISPNSYFVTMATLHSYSTATAIEDELPIRHMLALLPYALVSHTRLMRSYEQHLRCYFFVLRCRLISQMTCLFTNICLINLPTLAALAAELPLQTSKCHFPNQDICQLAGRCPQKPLDAGQSWSLQQHIRIQMHAANTIIRWA